MSQLVRLRTVFFKDRLESRFLLYCRDVSVVYYFSFAYLADWPSCSDAHHLHISLAEIFAPYLRFAFGTFCLCQLHRGDAWEYSHHPLSVHAWASTPLFQQGAEYLHSGVVKHFFLPCNVQYMLAAAHMKSAKLQFLSYQCSGFAVLQENTCTRSWYSLSLVCHFSLVYLVPVCPVGAKTWPSFTPL